jgi:hypothetical protein
MYSTVEELTLFDRINIANCAMLRAKQHILDNERFTGEYQTARSWVKYRCVITKAYSFVENN